jgi:hypothetical protein
LSCSACRIAVRARKKKALMPASCAERAARR